ncbi:hypothetical protein [Nonomuraea sp. LPB2021202275-12-8]|uniref:hypothetical protein n=1 Tax=Nonomuraea sp. LPB2021202275-12-8 TaxID=3120159 RepID=UPI00300D64AC
MVLPASQSAAQAQVVAAVENTSQESYRIHTESGDRTFEGAFDPVERVDVITRHDGVETRFVDDMIYVREGPGSTWTASPRKLAELESAPAIVSLVKLAPLDPQAALQRLRSATDVREQGPASGEGWTGERFTFSLEDDERGKILGATGSVDVDDQGRVRRLEIVHTETGHRNVMTIGDFGTPVSVEAPPASEVREQPAGKPIKQAGEPAAKPS